MAHKIHLTPALRSKSMCDAYITVTLYSSVRYQADNNRITLKPGKAFSLGIIKIRFLGSSLDSPATNTS